MVLKEEVKTPPWTATIRHDQRSDDINTQTADSDADTEATPRSPGDHTEDFDDTTNKVFDSDAGTGAALTLPFHHTHHRTLGDNYHHHFLTLTDEFHFALHPMTCQVTLEDKTDDTFRVKFSNKVDNDLAKVLGGLEDQLQQCQGHLTFRNDKKIPAYWDIDIERQELDKLASIFFSQKASGSTIQAHFYVLKKKLPEGITRIRGTCS